MKKLFYPLFVFAAMAMTTSCSQDEELVQQSGDMTTFKVELDGASQSRTAGDGQTVNELYYAVYDKDGEKVIYPANAKFGKTSITAGSATVDLPLMKSEEYDIVFWAQTKDANAYTFTELTNITVNYAGLKSNSENRDAFFNALDNYKAQGNTQTVELRRPFAQLNVATSIEDWKDATYLYQANGNEGNPVKYSSVTIDKLATTFNAKTGHATGETTAEIVFDKNDVLDESIWIEGKDAEGNDAKLEYKLLAMNYVLMVSEKNPQDTGAHEKAEGEDSKATVEVDFTLWKDAENEIVSANVPFAPIQRNYRTNIIGSFLTGDATQFNIVVDADFDNDHNVKPGIIFEDDNQIARIYSAEGLKDFAAYVNGEKSRAANYENFKGWTIYLENSIDLSSIDNWTPIGMSTNLGEGATFQGTFDGKGHTVSGMKVTQKDAAGLFGYVYGATIKNVTVDNATINSNHYAGGIVAWINNIQGNLKVPMIIENCHVKNSTITSAAEEVDGKWDNGDKVGGIVGYAQFANADYAAHADAKISGCSVENTTVKAYRDFGGLVGYAAYVALENISVSGITLQQDLTHDYKKETEGTPTTFGLIIGRNEGGNTLNGEVFVAYGVTKDAEGNFCIQNVDGLKWLAEQVNEGTEDFAGETVCLNADIDLNNEAWTPIGLNADDAKKFKGTFDGKGKTISNLKVETEAGYTAAGLFGALNGTAKNFTIDGASIKHISTGSATDNGIAVVAGSIYNTGSIENVTVKNATVEGNRYVGGIAGYVYGNIKDCTVETITLTATPDDADNNGSYDNGDKVGGIAGYFVAEGKFVISGNTVKGATIKGYRDLGGIVGSGIGQAAYVKYNTASDITITADQVTYFYEDKDVNANAIIGRTGSGEVIDESNEAVNVMVSSNEKADDGTAQTAITLVGDLTISDEAPIQTQSSTNAITVDGGGKTIVSEPETVEAFEWIGGTIPVMSTIFSSKNGAKVTVNNLNFSGDMSAVMLGNYVNSTYTNFNTELNNVNVIDAKVVSFSANISPAVVIYGTATLNGCNIYGTTLSELDTDPMWPVYDVAAVNYSTTTLKNCKIGSFYIWNQAGLIVDESTEIQTLVVRGNMNTSKYGVTIKSGTKVEKIDLSAITNKTKVNFTIEEGATVGKFVANGVEYDSLDAYKNAE